jgi:uncharacterized protein YndB with AHSA1/START domain/catechol 2,3-dioxygenase-like lactoylglutathione lyase family enzyme
MNAEIATPHEGTSTMTRRIVEVIEIAAPPARVFAALTDPVQLLAWWGDRHTFPSTHWELDARVGGRWLSRWRAPNGATFALGGEVLEIDPPRLLVYSWWDERYPDLPRTAVRYELTTTATGTRVTLTHDGFNADRADFDDYNGGWSSVMRSLRAHAEAGAFRTNRDIAIEVESLADAEAFYGGTLGFSIRSRSPDQLQLDTGSFTLWVNRVASRDDRRPFIPSLDVPSAAKARAALEDAGCRVVRDGTHGFYIEDPFGFTIDVIERDA